MLLYSIFPEFKLCHYKWVAHPPQIIFQIRSMPAVWSSNQTVLYESYHLVPGKGYIKTWSGFWVVWSWAGNKFIHKECVWFGLLVSWLCVIQGQRSDVIAIIVQHLQRQEPQPESVKHLLYDCPSSSTFFTNTQKHIFNKTGNSDIITKSKYNMNFVCFVVTLSK